MELTGISLRGYARINNSVIHSNCSKKLASSDVGVDLSDSPFRFSEDYNRFTATGCDNHATIVTNGSTIGACLSVCSGSNISTTGGCNGLMCCQTTIPPGIVSFKANMEQVLHTKDESGCKTAFMVDQSWLDERLSKTFVAELSNLSYVPTVLQWGKYQGYCKIFEPSEAFRSDNGYCWMYVDDRHLYVCSYPELEYDELSTSYITEDCPCTSLHQISSY